jgi:tetratricopeptide (TPR) repeat protein
LAAFQTLVRLVETWEELAVQFPDDAGFRSDLAASYWFIGYLLAGSGQPANGVRYFAKAKPLLLQLTQEVPDQPEYRADLARIHEALAGVGRAQDAEAECRAALVLREQLVEEFPESPQFRYELCNSLQGYIPYVRKRDPAEAQKLENRLIELGESLVREYPTVDLYRWELNTWKRAWLAAVAASGDQKAIEDALPKVDELTAQFSQDGDWQSLNDLAWKMVVPADGDERIAEAAVRSALRACELRPHEPACLNTLGVAQYRQGDYEAAIESLGRSLTLDYNYDDWSIGAVTDSYVLAMAHAQVGHAEIAEKWFRAADRWTALSRPTNEQLKRFREEAIEVVGIEAEPLIGKSATPETEQELFRLCLAADPQGHWMHLWMGTRLAKRGAWSEADELFTEAAASLPENSTAAFYHALVRLKLRNREGYRRACATMCEHLGGASDPNARYWLVWTCGIGPEAVADWSVPLGHAQNLLEKEPKNLSYLTALGSVLIRAGRFEEAAAHLAKANAAYQSGNGDGGSPLYPQIFLAMVHHKLGHAEEARRWLAEVRSGIKKNPLEKLPWNHLATIKLLLAEAEQMIASGD